MKRPAFVFGIALCVAIALVLALMATAALADNYGRTIEIPPLVVYSIPVLACMVMVWQLRLGLLRSVGVSILFLILSYAGAALLGLEMMRAFFE